MSAKSVIRKLGGVRAAARILGVPSGTVGSWNVVDRIPAKRQPAVLRQAKQFGIPLSPEDFFVGEDDANGSPSSASVVTDRPPLAAANHEEMFE